VKICSAGGLTIWVVHPRTTEGKKEKRSPTSTRKLHQRENGTRASLEKAQVVCSKENDASAVERGEKKIDSVG